MDQSAQGCAATHHPGKGPVPFAPSLKGMNTPRSHLLSIPFRERDASLHEISIECLVRRASKCPNSSPSPPLGERVKRSAQARAGPVFSGESAGQMILTAPGTVIKIAGLLGPLAQVVEHLPFKERVAGSSPARLTKVNHNGTHPKSVVRHNERHSGF